MQRAMGCGLAYLSRQIKAALEGFEVFEGLPFCPFQVVGDILHRLGDRRDGPIFPGDTVKVDRQDDPTDNDRRDRRSRSSLSC